MKNQLKLILFFSVAIIYGQEKRKLINGKVFFGKTVVSDVHIVNKSSNQGTNSNDDGYFEIPVIEGDTLQISHINLKEKIVFITKELLSKRTLEIELQEKIETLDEITLGKQRSILYVEPNLYPPPIVNATTLKLPYANSIVKKDDAIVKIRSGGLISIDNLINSLNGNNRRKRLLQKITQEDKALSKIRKHFTDDFFITDLNIKKENINSFLNYCFKKNVVNYYRSKELIKLTKILMDESKTFVQTLEIDSLMISKK